MSFRHYKTLLRKNWINWKRTPFGSILEALLPATLMAILVYLRIEISPQKISNDYLHQLRHPVYPIARPQEVDDVSRVSLYDALWLGDEMHDYTDFASYQNLKFTYDVEWMTTSSQKTYMPLVDPAGPFFFFPPHCHPKDGDRWHSPLIGYFKHGNQIEVDIISSLESLFRGQTFFNYIWQTLGSFDFLIDYYLYTMGFEFRSANNRSYMRSYGYFTEFKKFVSFGNFRFKEFADQQEFDEYVTHDDYGIGQDKTAICFAFGISENESKNSYELDLQFDDNLKSAYASVPKQTRQSASPSSFEPKAIDYSLYQWFGFAYFQNWVANAILKRQTGLDDASIMAMMIPIRMNPQRVDPFQFMLYSGLAFFIMIMYIPLIYRTIFRIVSEKQNRAKETMKMMGMSELSYWASWFTDYTLKNLVISTVSWGILYMWVFEFSSGMLLWFFIFLYGQSAFGLIMVAQTFFSSARYAGIATSIIYFGLSLLNNLVNQAEKQHGEVELLSLISPAIAMIQGIRAMVHFECAGVGADFNNWHLPIYGLSYKNGIFMLMVSCFYLPIIGMYLNQVTNTTFGVRRHACFCLIPNYWSCKKRSVKSATVQPTSDLQHRVDADLSGSDITPRHAKFGLNRSDSSRELSNDNLNVVEAITEAEKIQSAAKFETKNNGSLIGVPEDSYEKIMAEQARNDIKKRSLTISGLKKRYNNGCEAVQGINLKMFADQIFVLLGHNGAGKTSTIQMLTGLFKASEGSAEVFGVNIFEEIDEVRKFMGVCPQHDVLFELLTPREHLEIFSDFKGADQQNQTKEIDKLIKDAGLWPNRDKPSYELSGGNKRKLSVAIALCGGSKFILLDEPTSGLDLIARRQLWNMLREYKQDKIILLTTHYMDEADILGDRIGIMKEGQMECLGSPMFLKQRFGVGYVLKMNKVDEFTLEHAEEIVEFIFDALGEDVSLYEETRKELSFKIPNANQPKFKDFFAEFDTMLEEFGIQDYSIMMTTLTEVFEKVGGFNKNDEFQLSLPSSPDNPIISEARNFIDQSGSQSNRLPNVGATSLANPDMEDYSRFQSKSELKIHPDRHTIGQLTTSIPVKTANQKSSNKTIKKPLNKIFDLLGKEADHSFCNNFSGLCKKKLRTWNRDKRLFSYEVFIPGLIALFGVQISQVNWFQRSPSKLLTPDLLPLPQKLIMNELVVDFEGSDIDVQLLADNLPQQKAWDIYYSNEDYNLLSFSEAALEFGKQNSTTEPYFYNGYQIYQANRAEQKYKFFSHINMTSPDASILFPQFMYESILKVATDDPDFSFKVRSTPYPVIKNAKVETRAVETSFIVFIASITYSLVLAVLIVQIVEERLSKLKHFQMTQGMKLSTYWLVNFLTDLFKIYITIGINIAIYFAFDLEFEVAWIVLLIYPWGVLPFTYVTSFAYQSTSIAQTFTLFFTFVSIMILSLTTFFMRLYEELEVQGDFLNQLFKLSPSYCLAAALYFDNAQDKLIWVRDTTEGTGNSVSSDAWHITNVQGDCILLMCHFVFWTFVLILIEARPCYSKCCKRRNGKSVYNLEAETNKQYIDDDVLEEQERVNSQIAGKNSYVKVQNLRKEYKTPLGVCKANNKNVAVENLSFGLDTGECFALLGVNGAGKSTTFKTLTNEIDATSGHVGIGEYNFRTDFDKIRKLVGYCPQTNPIFEALTVEQHIDYYAQIKGIPSSVRALLVEETINELDLQNYRDTTSSKLSGGNKRKLSVAIAIIGNPKIILLDEPSAGMDPESRRFMWKVLARISHDKTSAIILTTHSMEEAEALSTKMGIMVTGGVFKCFGTPQHIKDKFSTGFIIEMKVKQPEGDELQFLLDCITSVQGSEQSSATRDQYMTIDKAEQKINDSELGDWVTRYTLIKLLKICRPKEEESQTHLLKLTNQQSHQLDLSSDIEMKIIQNAKTSKEEFIAASQLSKIIFTHKALFGAIRELCHTFNEVELLEHYGDYMKLKVPKLNKTVGSLFGIMETFKINHEVQDYSVSQTTLEQIFNDFAMIPDGHRLDTQLEINELSIKNEISKRKVNKAKTLFIDETGHLAVESDEIIDIL